MRWALPVLAGADGAMWFTDPPGRIGRIAPDGTVTHLSVRRPPEAAVDGLAAGPGADLWFSARSPYGGSWIGRITPGGRVTYVHATRRSIPDISPGPRGEVWFTEAPLTGGRVGAIGRVRAGSHWFLAGRGIGRVTRSGSIRVLGTRLPPIAGMAAGPDGNVWFTDDRNGRVGRMTPSGRVRTFSPGLRPTGDLAPGAIVAGPDGALWFAARRWSARGSRGGLGRITTRGVMTLPDRGRLPVLPPGVGVGSLAWGPDGSLWVTEVLAPHAPGAGTPSANRLARITSAGRLVEYPPTLRLAGVRRRGAAVVATVRCPAAQPAPCEAVLRLDGGGRADRWFVRVASGGVASYAMRPRGSARSAAVLTVALRTAAGRDAVRRTVRWRAGPPVIPVPLVAGRWRTLPDLPSGPGP